MELTPNKPKRGRPRKVVPESTVLIELIGVVRDTMRQQQQILQQMATAQQAQTELLTTWMRLMTPASATTPSTTIEDREALRANANLDWEPMSALRWDDWTPLGEETYAS
jgi:hypothetical protein